MMNGRFAPRRFLAMTAILVISSALNASESAVASSLKTAHDLQLRLSQVSCSKTSGSGGDKVSVVILAVRSDGKVYTRNIPLDRYVTTNGDGEINDNGKDNWINTPDINLFDGMDIETDQTMSVDIALIAVSQGTFFSHLWDFFKGRVAQDFRVITGHFKDDPARAGAAWGFLTSGDSNKLRDIDQSEFQGAIDNLTSLESDLENAWHQGNEVGVVPGNVHFEISATNDIVTQEYRSHSYEGSYDARLSEADRFTDFTLHGPTLEDEKRHLYRPSYVIRFLGRQIGSQD